MQTVEVRFKGNRKGFFTWENEAEPLRLQEPVIVEAERGLDFGRVNSTGDAAAKKCTSCATGCATGEGAADPPAVRAVHRRASQEEIKTANELRKIVIHTIAIGEFQKDFMKRLAEDNGGVFVDLGR
jgi:hypothetical protein